MPRKKKGKSRPLLPLRKKRRYEIAREMFVQHRMLAVAAVKEADDLIAALGYMPHA